LWAGLGVSVGSMLWIAYQWDVRNEATLVQRQVEAQHDEFVTQLQPLKDKIQGITVAQSRTYAEIAKSAEQSQPLKSEIQGLQNHVTTLVRQPRQQKK
jgi:peptidoglycan hydrolase CwlO-like protein